MSKLQKLLQARAFSRSYLTAHHDSRRCARRAATRCMIFRFQNTRGLHACALSAIHDSAEARMLLMPPSSRHSDSASTFCTLIIYFGYHIVASTLETPKRAQHTIFLHQPVSLYPSV
eukprot:6190614-Pleurochrysis_carterae.AAC.1